MRIRKKLLVMLLCSLSAACAAPQKDADLQAQSNDATRGLNACASHSIASVDDGLSDASTVALALAMQCLTEYRQATHAFALANLDNDAQRRAFRERRDSAQEKIETFLPVVMGYRNAVKSKSH